MTRDSDRASLFARGFGPALIAVAFVALGVWTWGNWPDVLVDFGRELYIPWRIGAGDVLYRDLAYFNGPLSPYVNALVFQILGASVRSLFLANLGLLALFTALGHRLLVELGDRFSALLATLVFLCVFAFGQLVGIGNYNFVAPYSHEVTHGLMLGVGALAALSSWRRSGASSSLAVGGAAIGLALLTKPETALAAAIGGIVTFAIGLKRAEQSEHAKRSTAIFAASIGAPIAIATLLLATAMPFGDALRAIATPWTSLVSSDATSLEFYRVGMGLDRPAENALAMLEWAGFWIAAFVPALLAAFALKSNDRAARLTSFAVLAIYAAALIAFEGAIPWLSAAKPLPIFAALALGIIGAKLARGENNERGQFAAPFAAFALVLLAKMALNARVQHYGFALALPATWIPVTALAAWIPNELDRRGARGDFLRAAAFASFAVFAFAHLEVTAGFLAKKKVVVGVNRDAFTSDIRGEFVNRAVAELAATPPESTFAVLPEGVTLNFLARRKSSSRFVNFMPPEVLLFGEDAMLADFVAHPPERIVLVHKDTREYGFALFGRDYGVKLMDWVRANYAAEAPIGDPPLVPGSRFGIQILVKH